MNLSKKYLNRNIFIHVPPVVSVYLISNSLSRQVNSCVAGQFTAFTIMVVITRPATMRLSPGMERAKDLLAGGPYGRKSIQEKDVPYIERLPLSLKNIVANTSMKGGQKACMDPMMEVRLKLAVFSFCKIILLGHQLSQQVWSEPVHVQQGNYGLSKMLL